MATHHGTLSEFVPGKTDWTTYVERLDHYFVANEVTTAAKKRAILLSACGTSTYKLIRSLLSAEELKSTNYANLVKLVKEYYDPKPYGGWLGPLSAILQFQLPLYSTLFPLYFHSGPSLPLYFHSTSTLNFRFHSISTLLPLYFHSISTLDFCFHSISTLFPFYLPSSWIGNGWLG